jgi:hypothetical protein
VGYGKQLRVDRRRDPFSIRATDLTTSTPFEGHFTIRTYFEPIRQVVKGIFILRRLAEVIRNCDVTVSVYKGTPIGSMSCSLPWMNKIG